MIKEPTHILDNLSSCIDLIFMSQPNLITQWGVHSSLHPDCHHQTIFAKVNLEIIYPPLYVCEFRHYKDATTELIRRANNEFNWQRAFLNTNVNKKVDVYNNTILTILNKLIPQESAVCDDKDQPWFNKKIRALTREKNAAFKNYCNNSSNIDLKCRLIYLQVCLNDLIVVVKEN